MPPLPYPTSTTALHTTSSLLRRASSSLSQSTTTFLSLLKRQTTTVIPADYSNIDSSQPPGTIIGIVLGSVAGFLLILWLLYTLMGGNMNAGASSDVGSVVIRERKRSRRGSSRRGSSRRESVEVREVREVRRERPVPVVERVIVEERRESRPAPAVVVESSIGTEDEVVVIEEHSPPRRASGSKRVKEVREVREVRESGYRPVDPLAYGGGDEPLRDVDRRGSRRSNR
jgi:hypothetical protein